jgi:hypothetical protein
MPSPQDSDHTSSAGLALSDSGAETGHPLPTKEEGTVKVTHPSTRFWLVITALVLGLATLVIGIIFFLIWSTALSVEVMGSGLALLAVGGLLLGPWRIPAERASSATIAPAPASAPPEDSPAVEQAPADVASEASEVRAEREAAPIPEIAPVPEAPPEAVVPDAPPEASAAASEETPAPEAAPEAAPARKATRPRTSLKPSNGHTDPSLPTPAAGDLITLAKPSLSALPESYPRPSGGYTLDTEAEDLSQLLGDVAEQTVIVMATKGQHGIERRERMATKIDTFSHDMAVDPNYAPVVDFLTSISALLRAGQPIPATQTLVDPFDGLYGYVLTLIRRKTGGTHN